MDVRRHMRHDGLSRWTADRTVPPGVRDITVADLLDDAVRRRPDGEAIVYSAYDDYGITVRWTYERFAETVREAAAAVVASGLRRGDRAVVWATNLPQFPVLQMAFAATGVAMVPINPLYRKLELEHVLRLVEPRAIFLVPEDRRCSLWDLLDEASREHPSVRHRVALGEAPDARGVGWDQWLRTGVGVDDADLDARRAQVDPDDLALIQFTSGTTGMPKGVQLTHRAVANQGPHLAARLGLRADDRCVNPMPLFHCGGCVVVTLSVLAATATQLPMITFDPRRMAETIERERVTVGVGVPTMQIAVEEEVERAGQDLRSLRAWVGGGTVTPPELAERWQKRYGIDFMVTYGQTEFGPVAAATSPDDPPQRQVATAGRPLPCVDLDVVVPGTDTCVPIGQEGELRYRGWTMVGYRNDEAATKEVLSDDGWLRSGDLGSLDEDGYVTITGRAKDLIIRGGENISPAAIEYALAELDEVADAAVIGVPDERYGEAVCACVRLVDGARLTLPEVRERLTGRIARYNLPTQLHVLDAFPTTPSGKVQKFRLRELLAAQAEARPAGTPR